MFMRICDWRVSEGSPARKSAALATPIPSNANKRFVTMVIQKEAFETVVTIMRERSYTARAGRRVV